MGSSRNHAEIFAAALTRAERTALKAIASGAIGGVTIPQLKKLYALGLISDDPRGIALTSGGLAIVDFC